MNPGPAIAFTVAAAAGIAGLLEMLPAAGPPPAPMLDAIGWLLEHAAECLDAAARFIRSFEAGATIREPGR